MCCVCVCVRRPLSLFPFPFPTNPSPSLPPHSLPPTTNTPQHTSAPTVWRSTRSPPRSSRSAAGGASTWAGGPVPSPSTKASDFMFFFPYKKWVVLMGGERERATAVRLGVCTYTFRFPSLTPSPLIHLTHPHIINTQPPLSLFPFFPPSGLLCYYEAEDLREVEDRRKPRGWINLSNNKARVLVLDVYILIIHLCVY